MLNKKFRRTSVTVPIVVDNMVEKYMELTGIKTWNAALFDLARIGFSSLSKEGGEK